MKELMRGLGIIIIGTVILVLLGYGCRDFFINDDILLAIRIGVGVIGGGILVLVVRAIKAKLTRNKTEESKEVEQ